MESINLIDLIGPHNLSGVDTVNRLGGYDNTDNCQVVNFVLDDKTYTAVENPSDGYRSMLDKLYVSTEKVENIFSPVAVLVIYRDTTRYGEKSDMIEFYDTKNGKLIMEIGTGNTDDYYPYFVGSFYPDKMSLND